MSASSGPLGPGTFHRYEDDYLTPDEWGSLLNVDARVALALGTEPIEDARHLLPPLEVPAPPAPPPPGPNPATGFVVEFTRPAGASPAAGTDARALLGPDVRAGMDFPQAWAESVGRGGAPLWSPLDGLPDTARATRLALVWPLADLLSEGAEAAADLARFTRNAGHIAAGAGWTARALEGAQEAARRAARLLDLKRRFGQSVEMRLLPAGSPFAARDVWRAAYGLGLTWGDLDLFHWHDRGVTGRRLFTLSGAALPGYFLPERAAEGERVAGVALSFELPYSPAPLAVYDRMAVALSYLRQKLGGRPVARSGVELDADRLYDDRDALEEAVGELERAGIAPGSPEAARFF